MTAPSRRILVVGINYDPEVTGIAPYTTQAARHLADNGDDVLVLTGTPHYPGWSRPPEFGRLRRLEREDAGVRIRHLRHFIPRRQSVLRRGLYEVSFGLHVASERLPWRPDIVLGVVPSLLGGVAAARIARRHDAAFVVWVQDLMSQATTESGIPGGGRATALAAAAERQVFTRADAVAVASPTFRSHVITAGAPAESVTVVRNWSHVAEPVGDAQACRVKLGWPARTIVALHSGNMGLKQGLENVVAAAEIAARLRLPVLFVIMGNGNQREAIDAMARGLPTLQLLPPAEAEDFPEILAAADVLVLNERPDLREMSLPSKLTSYLVTGRPVVAAVDPHGASARELERAGCGVVVRSGDAQALLQAVVETASDASRARSLGDAGRNYAREHLSAEAALSKLDDVLHRAEVAAGNRSHIVLPVGTPAYEPSRHPGHDGKVGNGPDHDGVRAHDSSLADRHSG